VKLDFERIGKHRLVFGYVIAAACLILASQRLFLPGVIVALSGIAFRMWAAGCIEKNRQLAVSGPYALTRNPLCLGSLMLGFGGVMAVRAWWLLAAYVPGFAVFYWPTILREEKDLLAMFGERFRAYQKHVPAFVPWKLRLPKGRFSWENMVRNGELKHALTYVAFLVLLGALGEVRMLLAQ